MGAFLRDALFEGGRFLNSVLISLQKFVKAILMLNIAKYCLVQANALVVISTYQLHFHIVGLVFRVYE